MRCDAFDRIDILVNNAGIYGPIGPTHEIDWDAWVDAININLLGLVYACRAVTPIMIRQKSGKIINLSGGGATNPLPRMTSYAASKAAVVRFTESLALDLKPHGIDVNAIAPGALDTRLLDQVLDAGPETVGAEFHERMVKIKQQGRHAAVGRGRARRLPCLRRKQRHYRAVDLGGLGQVADAARARKRT